MYGHGSCKEAPCTRLALQVEPHEGDEVTTEEAPPAALRTRDWAVVRELARQDDAEVGFQGIKRALDLHPEALRRTLARLQRDGYVEKSARGYVLTEGGHGLVAGRAIGAPRQRTVPVAALLLPTGLTPQRVADAFVRRWFDGLRWYGVANGSDETSLTWLTEKGGHPVRLRIRQGAVQVEAPLGAGYDPAVTGVAPLVQAIAQLVRSTPAPKTRPRLQDEPLVARIAS